MAENKKPTNKERDQQLGWLTQTLNKCFNILGAYIEFKGDDTEFKKFLLDKEEEMKKQQKEANATNDTKVSDTSSDKGDSKAVQAG